MPGEDEQQDRARTGADGDAADQRQRIAQAARLADFINTRAVAMTAARVAGVIMCPMRSPCGAGPQPPQPA